MSCTDDSSEQAPPADILSGEGVFILNEGGFNFGNASLSFYRFSERSVKHDLFQEKSGLPLGDVLQSAFQYGDQLFLCLNNSNQVKILTLPELELQATVSGLTSPRYLATADGQTAFVTDLYADGVQVLDLGTQAITESIPVEGWTEELHFAAGRLFVCQRLSHNLLVIDTAIPAVVNVIEVAYDPSALQQDQEGRLWVYCSGDAAQGETGGIFQVDPVTGNVLKNLPFDSPAGFGWPRLAMNPDGSSLYVLQQDLYVLPLTATGFPEQALIKGENRNFYGLGIDPATGEIYLADAIDYQQRGRVYRYTAGGELLDDFEVGVIPNGFLFY